MPRASPFAQVPGIAYPPIFRVQLPFGYTLRSEGGRFRDTLAAAARHSQLFVTVSGLYLTGAKRAPGEIYVSAMNTPEPASPAPPRLAAIDVGTNTIRLTVAEVQEDDTYRVL